MNDFFYISVMNNRDQYHKFEALPLIHFLLQCRKCSSCLSNSYYAFLIEVLNNWPSQLMCLQDLKTIKRKASPCVGCERSRTTCVCRMRPIKQLAGPRFNDVLDLTLITMRNYQQHTMRRHNQTVQSLAAWFVAH